jgi:hypothetical protein
LIISTILLIAYNSLSASSLLLDANADGLGLRVTYLDKPNVVNFPDLSGNVVLDTSTGVVTSQVCDCFQTSTFFTFCTQTSIDILLFSEFRLFWINRFNLRI